MVHVLLVLYIVFLHLYLFVSVLQLIFQEMDNVDAQENGEEEEQKMETDEPTAEKPSATPSEPTSSNADTKSNALVDSLASVSNTDQTVVVKEEEKAKAPATSTDSPVFKAPIMDMVSNPLAYLNALSQRAKENKTALSEVAKQEGTGQTASDNKAGNETMDMGTDSDAKGKTGSGSEVKANATIEGQSGGDTQMQVDSSQVESEQNKES